MSTESKSVDGIEQRARDLFRACSENGDRMPEDWIWCSEQFASVIEAITAALRTAGHRDGAERPTNLSDFPNSSQQPSTPEPVYQIRGDFGSWDDTTAANWHYWDGKAGGPERRVLCTHPSPLSDDAPRESAVPNGYTLVENGSLWSLERRARVMSSLRNEEVWYWQGDGHDFPESISCPVVMSADTLRALLSTSTAPREAAQEPGSVCIPRDELERTIKTLRYASHPAPSPHADALAEYLTEPQQREGAIRLTRYGFPIDGKVQAMQMADGYWTPWHIAQEALDAPLRPVTDSEVLRVANALRVHGWAAGGDDQEFEDDVRAALESFRARLAGEGA